VTCPKCGFVSFPGLARCKKCGHSFSSERLGGIRPTANPDEARAADPSSFAEPQDDASVRMARFRRRRSRPPERDGEETALEMNFEPEWAGSRQDRSAYPELDAVLYRQEPSPLIDCLELKDAYPGRGVIAASVASPEVPLDFTDNGSGADSGASPFAAEAARLGPRAVAGVIDLTVMLAAVALFASVFYSAGGRIHPRPANLAVVAATLALLALTYFGLFNTLAFRTLGEALTGLDVRSLDGSPPTLSQRCWRSFGYLVSAAALMLGFVWAAVDSDGLTWHDRMSGTYLVEPGRSKG
jgi:uncharacterized RDD family membrane protein YckC